MKQDSNLKTGANNEIKSSIQSSTKKKKSNDCKFRVFKSTPKNMKIDSRVEFLAGGEEIASPKDTNFPSSTATMNNSISSNKSTAMTNSNSTTMSNSNNLTIENSNNTLLTGKNSSIMTSVSPSSTTITMSSSPSVVLLPEPLLQESSSTVIEPMKLDPSCQNSGVTATTSSATTITTTTTTTCSNGATLNGVKVIKRQR